MRRAAIATALAAVVLAVAMPASGCTRTSDGQPTVDVEAQPSATASSPARSPTTIPGATDAPGPPAPGIAPTTDAPPGAGPLCAPTSRPPVSFVAKVSDPHAPTATVAVPDGWSMSAGGGDVGARLQGPSGMQAIVSIAPTDADPEEAFRDYADELTEGMSITTVSLLPAQMCGLSGQKLLGFLSDGTDTVQYQDRIVHVPTIERDYLVAVHVTAPSDTPGFDDEASVLTEEFEIVLP